jgi:hypothetical protein
MGPTDLALHLLNFIAPALFIAVLMPLAARIFMKKKSAALAWRTQAAINFVVGLLLLTAGLWFFGQDGKMATYAALVLGCATSQALMLRNFWR